MPQLDPRVAAEIVRTLRDHVPVQLPSWAHGNESDPGITLLGLFAFLAEQFLDDAAPLPRDAATGLARLGTRLADLDPSDGPFDVHIDGERWQPVSTLEEAEADAAVFELDAERGALHFGDGIHGRRPPDGSVVRVRCQTGRGAARIEVAITTRWPLPDAAWAIRQRTGGRIVVQAEDDPLERDREGSTLQRVAYFTGQLLTADDFQAEQNYVRARLRRLNRAQHGVGVIAGLAVAISHGSGGSPSISVSPGFAVDPRGEDLVLQEPAECAVPDTADGTLLVLRAVERPTAFVTSLEGAGERRATRIEEGVALSLEGTPDDAAVVLGRLVRDPDGWRLEPV